MSKVALTGDRPAGASIETAVHVQNQGWLRAENDRSSWFTSGEVAGTAGLSRRLEGIRIVLVKDE